jgi:hypothetical protein
MCEIDYEELLEEYRLPKENPDAPQFHYLKGVTEEKIKERNRFLRNHNLDKLKQDIRKKLRSGEDCDHLIHLYSLSGLNLILDEFYDADTEITPECFTPPRKNNKSHF